jgi:hypothetical protein
MGKTKTKPPKGRKEKPKKITITNNAPRLICVTYGTGATGSDKIELKPGPNAVDRHLFEQHLKAHPTVVKYAKQRPGQKGPAGKVKRDDTMILDIDESGPPVTADKEVAEAVAVIETVCDTDLLYELESDDERPQVQKAIDERRAEIGPTEPAKKKD